MKKSRLANNNINEVFNAEKSRFEKSVLYSIAVSKLSAGRPASIPTQMASYVFTRMCITAETASHLAERGISDRQVTLDHYSISVISRNIIEAGLMFHYLTEQGVDDDEWKLRGKILDLHEVLVKLRFFKGQGIEEVSNTFREYASELREQIKKISTFNLLDKDRQQKIIGGQELYIRGSRAVAKLLEVDMELFDGIYNYLSAQVHVSSHSYYDTERKLDFESPAEYQLYATSFALAMARYVLLHSAIRYVVSDSAVVKEVGTEVINSMKGLMDLKFGDLDNASK